MEKLTRQFRLYLFFAGAFNIALAGPLMLPASSAAYIELLWALNERLGLGGTRPQIHAGIEMLFANTVGLALVLVGVVVLYAGFDPSRRRFIPLANGIARILFAALTTYYCAVYDVARIVLVIGLLDLLIALGLAYFLGRLSLVVRPPSGR